MPRFSSVQYPTFTWNIKDVEKESVIILNPSFSNPVNPTNNRTLVLSNLLSTQPVPDWTFLTESSSFMIGRGSTIYNMSDATSLQYLIASYAITEDVYLTQQVSIPISGLYKIKYITNGRLAFQNVTITAFLTGCPPPQKTVGLPNSAQWVQETYVVNVPSPGTYTLNIRFAGINQQISSITNISMNRFERVNY